MASELTHRQFTTLEVWLRNQWNSPSRSDNYTMQLTAVVRSFLEGKVVNKDECKIPWTFSYQTDDPRLVQETEIRLNQEAEQRTMAALGVNWEYPDGGKW